MSILARLLPETPPAWMQAIAATAESSMAEALARQEAVRHALWAGLDVAGGQAGDAGGLQAGRRP